MSTTKLNHHNYRVDLLLGGKPATWYVSVTTKEDIEVGIFVLLVALGRLRRRASMAFQIVGVQYRRREPTDGLKLTITEDRQAWADQGVWEQMGLGREAARADATPGGATPNED